MTSLSSQIQLLRVQPLRTINHCVRTHIVCLIFITMLYNDLMPEANTYNEYSDALRVTLADPSVNKAEHTIYWPKLKLFLPPKNQVSRILDYGCGPGNFTEELAQIYPDAEVIGTDASPKILPRTASKFGVEYGVWDGSEPLGLGSFDLVIAKMVLHYIEPGSLPMICSNIAKTLDSRGRLVYEIPHPHEERRVLGLAEGQQVVTAQTYKRFIGKTGVEATMTARDESVAILSFLHALPDDYGIMVDDIFPKQRRTWWHPVDKINDRTGYQKRKIVALFPEGDYEQVYQNLRRSGHSASSPKVLADVSRDIASVLRQLPPIPDR